MEQKPRPLFSIPVSDLEYGDREIDEDIPVEWLATALSETEATPRGTPGHFEGTVSKNGRDVMVRGRATAAVSMPCARTLDPVPYDIGADIVLLLSPASPQPHAPAKISKKAEKAAARSENRAPQKTGTGRPAKREEEAELQEEDAARDTFDGERVVLDGFIREFLVLELPMFPLREDLRSEATPAIERPPEAAASRTSERETIDPRLAPLAALASKLRDKKE